MLEIRDPAIKLFGQTIPVAAGGEIPAVSVEESVSKDNRGFGVTTGAESIATEQKRDEEQHEEDDDEVEMETEKGTSTESVQEDDSPSPAQSSDKDTSMIDANENSKTFSGEKDDSVSAAAGETRKDTQDSTDTKNSQDKSTLKKPDKILPCPRCNSMDTKFCYYNNYNVNQPRHFCKSCQRYWTAGGTMRNVPVGAGRRKNKNSAMRYCQITVSEALQAARMDGQNGVHVHHPGMKTNGTVLTFGPESQSLSVSMASVLNLADHEKGVNAFPNGVHEVDHVNPVPVTAPCKNGGNGDDHSNGSTVTTINMTEDGAKKGQKEPIAQNLNGMSNQIPCFPGTHWPYSWNGAVPLPAFCPPVFPTSFHPAQYWNPAIPWSMPWLPTNPCTPTQNSPNSNPSSPLGKHSRDGETLSNKDAQKNSGAPVLVPKTLRIDDPEDAAKSSIWTTLGIKKEKSDRNTAEGFFKGLQSKSKEKKHKMETSSALNANPAALARSISFQEKV